MATLKSATTQEKQAMHRQFVGEVVSHKTDKTATILVHSKKLHPKYKKTYAQSTKFAVHDEKNETKEGDMVLFEESRPYSKTKRWRVVRIMNNKA